MLRAEIRADGMSMHISGYVNAICRDSRPIVTRRGKVVEQINQGVFADAIERAENIDLRLNHAKDKNYASTKDGTLKLYEDNIGLRAECDVTDEVLIEKARRKELRGWSFGAFMDKDRIEERADNVPRRYIERMDLFEVSLIDYKKNPCYTGTTIEQRAEDEIIIEERSINDETELVETPKQKEKIDYSEYENRIESLKAAK